LLTRMSRSACKIWEINDGEGHSKVYQVEIHIPNFWEPEESSELSCRLPEVENKRRAKPVQLKNTQLLQHLKVFTDKWIFVLNDISRPWSGDRESVNRGGL
jgi:hypothetical protein